MAPPNKKRKVVQEEEITFDYEARHDYLTGFHKRKQQRIKDRQDAHARKERAQKIEERKQVREQRRKDLEQHVEHVNSVLKKIDEKQRPKDGSKEESQDTDKDDDSEGSSFKGFGDPEAPEEVLQDQEYIDEDLYTTVTVNPMNLSDEEDDDDKGDNVKDTQMEEDKKAIQGRSKIGRKTQPQPDKETDKKKPKKKKKKQFRYESKAERQVTRKKERAKGAAAKKLRKSIRK